MGNFHPLFLQTIDLFGTTILVNGITLATLAVLLLIVAFIVILTFSKRRRSASNAPLYGWDNVQATHPYQYDSSPGVATQAQGGYLHHSQHSMPRGVPNNHHSRSPLNHGSEPHYGYTQNSPGAVPGINGHSSQAIGPATHYTHDYYGSPTGVPNNMPATNYSSSAPASHPPASHPPASHPPASHPPASHPPASYPDRVTPHDELTMLVPLPSFATRSPTGDPPQGAAPTEDGISGAAATNGAIEIKPQARLVYVSGGEHLPKQFIINADTPVRFGRSQSYCDCTMNDIRVSRLHAVIVQQEGHFYLQDEGSSGGTFINSRQVNIADKEKIQNGDMIRFNTIAYQFHLAN